MGKQRSNSCGHPSSASDKPEQLLTIVEVAEWLGVSTSTLYHHDPGEGPTRISSATRSATGDVA